MKVFLISAHGEHTPNLSHSADADKPAPVPESLVPQFGKKLNLHSTSTSRKKKSKRPPDFGEKIVYSRDCVARWWPVGSGGMIIYVSHFVWNAPPTRFSSTKEGGNHLFYGSSTSLEILRSAAWNRPWKTFYTNIPSEFIEEIVQAIVPKIGFYFHKEKDHYYVKISDKNQPKTTITCKCTAAKDLGKLKMYKIRSSLVRHMVEDISCLDKNLDLRIMLCKKRKLMEIERERGLRWPLGKEESSEDRFTVVGAWHTKHRKFKLQDLDISLYLRCADRFDFVTSKGEFPMKSLSRYTKQDDILDAAYISKTLEDAVKLAWENFLDCSYPLGN
ncbi:unnamed protein product [Spirodela intermedia]|uniref:DUF7903 domain-containing protein n=1 Tax=Spirodela intermedia TaxID=51605 RepID=A0A7I8J1R4_SPIIN|nr:unnamed protein product [Spirodela intermedia]CAA6664077.1 unnamed protein product [Spirodela intermedia]